MSEIQRTLPGHTIIGDRGVQSFRYSSGGEDYITSKLQEKLDRIKEVIADICKISNIQEKLVLLLQCIPGKIQHLLAAIPMNLSRDFAKQHDETLFGAVVATLELGNLTEKGQTAHAEKNI